MLFRIVVFCAFIVVGVLECAAHIRRDGDKQKIFKPLCMPLLILLYLLCAGTGSSLLIILGLFFGMLGDTFLLKDDNKSFMLGAGSFLLGHVCYIIAFLTRVRWDLLPVHGKWAFSALIFYILYLAAVAEKLLPSLEGAVKPGIIAYMGVILLMSYSTLLLLLTGGTSLAVIPFAGSLLFILSDTVLAFSVFQKKAHWPVMPTYLAAQFLIMLGAVLLF